LCCIYTLFAIFAALNLFTLTTDKSIATSLEPKKEGIKSLAKKKATATNKVATKKNAISEPKEKTKPVAKKAVVKKSAVSPKNKSEKTVAAKKLVKKQVAFTKITFQLKFRTEFGQNLFITGNHQLLGNNQIDQALPLLYLNEDNWYVTIEVSNEAIAQEKIFYNYVLKNTDGTHVVDWGKDKCIEIKDNKLAELLYMDTWNHAGYFENVFYTNAFQSVLLKANYTEINTKSPKRVTHILRIKSPLLTKGQTICVTGSAKEMGEWKVDEPVLLSRSSSNDQYEITLDLSNALFPIAYKYGIYDVQSKQFISFEEGNNRVLFDTVIKKKQSLVNDGYTNFSSNTWRAAGVSIPVFSLRTNEGFGVGEFNDLKALVDWSVQVGLKMIQILPINDTTATMSSKDSYPYAAISAFALHPLYINLEAVASKKQDKELKKLVTQKQLLNGLADMDYDAVIQAKIKFLRFVFKEDGVDTLGTKGFKDFFEQNQDWLVSYAVFCYLRDEYGTVDFGKWPAYKVYNEQDIAALVDVKSAAYTDIAFYYFVQYHLHLQLKTAAAYAHSKGVILKGDIAIGVYRYGADTWQHPELFNMDFQAGAPPDDFAITGQNWGFPTYNWQRMQEDGFSWWKQRFEQMNHYFDAFRIDHILGFFRIWSIPMHAVEGIMGHFVPDLPIHIHEFNQQGIWFDYNRYTKPFITEEVIWELFGYDNELVKSLFLDKKADGNYTLKPDFTTQRKVEKHFASLEMDEQHEKICKGLYSLISNVILFDAKGDGLNFHFRFGMENTSSYKYLEYSTQQQLSNLYINYFFKRQDDFWKKEALNKLPALKRVTNMIVCGEDLGLVPNCVPDVMQQLGLLSLEIQRMPKDATREFFHPNDAPYLSVVTPSTHDMSTIRGWWGEDKARIQRFYNNELGQWGDAPFYCEAWINKAVIMQHLYSPAMWSVFQLQDLMGINEKIRRANPMDEQINVPADPTHYWKYRMHITLNELQEASDFNEDLIQAIHSSGR
jgi:4-alpha-glucanotransferase